MNPNELRVLLRARPYHPFTVCLASHKTYSVPHPEFAALSPDGETLIVFPSKGGHAVVDVRQIERVEVRKRPAPPH